MSDQMPPTFSDVAIYFSEDEWALLDVHQKELYRSTMRENYDTLVSLGMAPVKSEMISLFEEKKLPVWDLQDSTATVKKKGIKRHSSFDNTTYSCLVEMGKNEPPSFKDPWELIEPVKIKDSKTNHCNKNFRNCDDVPSQAAIEENENLSQWKPQAGVSIKEEETPRVFHDSLSQEKNKVETVMPLVDYTETLDPLQLEEIQTPSVWDVRDSTELVKVSWEVQCARALKNVPDLQQTTEEKQPSFKCIPGFSGQRTIEQWEELFTWHIENSSVKGKANEVKIPFYKECLVSSHTVDIEQHAAESACDIEDSIVEVVIAQWENQTISDLQDCNVGVENRELEESSALNRQDTTDRVMTGGKKSSFKQVMGCGDQDNNIEGEDSRVMDFHDPIVQRKATKKPSAKVLENTMCSVIIKKEEQPVRDTTNYLDLIKPKESKESSFSDYQRLIDHIKIERNEELYASEHEDHCVEMEIEEGDEVIACDLQGLPMILIRNDEELSIGAECVVNSISGENSKDKIIIGKSTKELTPSYIALGKIKEEPQPLIKQDPGNLAGDSQEHTTDFEKRLNNQKNSTGHGILQTEENMYQCTICSKSFTRKYTLTMHMKTHKGRRRPTCITCKRSFKKYSHLVTHQRSHKEKIVMQSEDKTSFIDQQALQSQKLSEERSVETVNQRDKLYASMESGHQVCNTPPCVTKSDKHLEIKPYTCTECGKSYSKKCNLTTHMEIHGYLDPNKCGICGRRFILEANLLKHKLIHAGVLKCGECGEIFNWRPQLTAHLSMHFREKLNKCSECGKGFPTPYALSKHQLSHAGENPYLCSLCGESFSDTSSFLKHHKSHRNLKSYNCHNCTKQFSNYSSCLEHEKKCWTDNVHLVMNMESVSAAV